MSDTYDEGVAFICEGDTEKVFYISMLAFLSKKHGARFHKKPFADNPDVIYVLEHSKIRRVIKFYVAGAISSIPKAEKWFEAECSKKYLKKSLWTVYLCYDTDSYEKPVSQFREGDWKDLRERIGNVKRIVDLAAAADIEDVFLVDLDGICKFLDIQTRGRDRVSGRKGTAKLKSLYKEGNKTYHKGERAQPLIDALDMQKIINGSVIPLKEVEVLFA